MVERQGKQILFSSESSITKGSNTVSMPYGTQLSFWDDDSSERNIVFSITYWQHGCPCNGIYEARDKETTIFAQQFESAVREPTKYLLAVQKHKPRTLSERLHYYIADDQWEAYAKISDLTGRSPLWRMDTDDLYLPSNYSSQGPKC